MAEAEELERKLLRRQNAGGGWGYHAGDLSWTEPTALALLALEACGGGAAERALGYGWLRGRQREDGGWPPAPGIHVSTWVTSLAVLALAGCACKEYADRGALDWIIAQMHPQPGPLNRWIGRVLGMPQGERFRGGACWFPGTAPWVAPTAISVLALRRAAAEPRASLLLSYVRDGQHYLRSRRLKDGGWDHGGDRFGPGEPNSYPETTGIALLALSDAPEGQMNAVEMEGSLRRAEKFVEMADSAEELSWLQLALLRHGRPCPPPAAPPICRNTRDIALRLLALAVVARKTALFGTA